MFELSVENAVVEKIFVVLRETTMFLKLNKNIYFVSFCYY